MLTQISFPYLSALCVLCCLFLCPTVHAQEETPFSCGTDAAHENRLQTDPEFAKKIHAFEKIYRESILKNGTVAAKNSVVYTIPVVVHIVHNGAPLGSIANPTDATVAAIVQEASARFRHTHPGADSYTNPFYGADTEIELCLATTDPGGNYTSGVTRHYDPVNAVGTYGAIYAGLDAYAWNKSLYCNLFIVTDLTNASGVAINDVTIYDSPAFWSGLIAHEVGHYFSLAHSFNGGCPNGNCLTNGDFVCDTPPKAISGFTGTPCASPGNSCTTDEDDTSLNNPYRPVAQGGMGDQPDMLANYMDYTGSCWDSYTQGQKVRMRTYIDTYRVALKNNSAACAAQPTPANDAGITAVVLNSSFCSAAFTPQLTFKNHGSSPLVSVAILVAVNGTTVVTQNWTGSLTPGSSQTITLANPVTLNTNGTQLVTISTSNPNGSSDANIYNDTDYRSVDYYGGTFCQAFQGCANFNPSTGSGSGNTTIVNLSSTFPALPVSVTGVQICVSVEGDISAASEIFSVIDESGISRGITNSGTDCGGLSPAFCFVATASDYGVWKADGTIVVTLNPVTPFINPTLCSQNRACVVINVPQDCLAALSLSNVISAGTYQAGTSIQADGQVLSPANVILKAGSAVELLPGFEAQTGATLELMIGGCN